MNRWMGNLAVSLALLFGMDAALAASSKDGVRKQIEASMLVQGTIDIDEAGKVIDYQIKQADAVPKAMLEIVDKRVRAWQFEPVQVDGKAVRARSPMQMRLVTRKEGDRFLFRIGGATFGTTYEKEESVSARGRLPPPRYPEVAVDAGVGGTVYLVLRIGRDGKVEEAVAEQVNLRTLGSQAEMERFRVVLAESAIGAAKRWRFDYPTRGGDADAPFVSVRLPVDYVIGAQKLEKAGQWQAYVPGPRQRASWLPPEPDSASADALAAWGIYPVGKGPRLLTSLEES